MSEKVKCPNCKNGWVGSSDNQDIICPVCHGTGFAPAPPDEGIREETAKLIHTYHWRIVTDKRGKDNLTPDILNGWLNELADQILSLTASHYIGRMAMLQVEKETMAVQIQVLTEKIKELEEKAKEQGKIAVELFDEVKRLKAELHQAEQETARKMIEFYKDSRSMRDGEFKKKYPDFKFKFLNVQNCYEYLESKYGVSK